MGKNANGPNETANVRWCQVQDRKYVIRITTGPRMLRGGACGAAIRGVCCFGRIVTWRRSGGTSRLSPGSPVCPQVPQVPPGSLTEKRGNVPSVPRFQVFPGFVPRFPRFPRFRLSPGFVCPQVSQVSPQVSPGFRFVPRFRPQVSPGFSRFQAPVPRLQVPEVFNQRLQ